VISQSEAQWRKRLAASLDVATVPKDLQPPLTDVPKDHEDGRCLFMSDSNFQQCRIGSPTAKKTVALLGDEHAMMWTTALRNILLPLGYAIQPLTMGGCPNARITVFDHALPNHGRECDKHRAWVFRKLAVMNPDTVVMSDFSGFADYTGPDGKRTTIGVRDAWATGLERTLAKIHPLTHHIVVLGQTPRGRALEKCLPSSLNLSRCYGDDVYLSGIRVMEKRIITDINGMYVDPGPWLCVAESCPPIIDKTPVYFDDNHFTVTLTKRLTPLLRTKLRPITHPVKLQHP
jgi:hypothetical protein